MTISSSRVQREDQTDARLLKMRSCVYLCCPPAERHDVEQRLSVAGLGVVWAESLARAVSELQRRDMPVFLDLSAGPVVLQYARELRVQRPRTLMFAVADVRQPELTVDAVVCGIAELFGRPLEARQVAKGIARAARHQSNPSGTQDGDIDHLYDQSPPMRGVTALVRDAGATRAGVLICGEEGSGRQVVARAIHAADPNSESGRFVCVNCAAFNPQQLGVELFGTDAPDSTSRGPERVSGASRLHDALGGTMYLQNLAEMSTRIQGRLARLLRDREAVLSESAATIPFDVRVGVGVDESFDAVIQEGRVRDDLFRRLSAVRIDIPPLRLRREDIPSLTNYFLREICASLGLSPKLPTRAALLLLTALPWRGNATELRTLLETLVVGSRSSLIGTEDVLIHIRLDGGSVGLPTRGTLRQARERFEREYITAILEQHRGRITEAANALGIQRTNLYRKMRTLQLSRRRR